MNFAYLARLFLSLQKINPYDMFKTFLFSLISSLIMTNNEKPIATYSMHVEGKDIVITDIIYIMNDDDNDNIDIIACTENKGELHKIGCPNSITATGCDVVKSSIYNKKGEVISQFCSDSYIIGCFLLEEVLKHNPKLAKDLEELPYAFAIIRNFTGDITFTIKEEKVFDEKMPILNIRGKGNINFHSDYEPGYFDED